MSAYKVCENCGSNLDHGESCDCRREQMPGVDVSEKAITAYAREVGILPGKTILPCPLCGAPVDLFTRIISGVTVECFSCRLATPAYKTIDEARDHWNRRSVKAAAAVFKSICNRQDTEPEETACRDCPISKLCGSEPCSWEV